MRSILSFLKPVHWLLIAFMAAFITAQVWFDLEIPGYMTKITVLLNEGYAPNYRIEVDRVNNTDTLDVYVELTPERFADTVSEIDKMERELAGAITNILGIHPVIHLVAPKSIQRSEGKAVRVIDRRKLHD